jgi:glycosyltransferase involved in cell wall biosynthesis
VSCLTQNYKNYEIVCVFDGTTDKSESVLLSAMNQSDIYVRIVHHETNRGLLLARRSGVRVARGMYIMSLDADDAFAPNIFDSVVRVHRETGADVVYFDTKRSVNGGALRIWKWRAPPKNVFNNEELRKAAIAGKFMWNVWLVSVGRILYLRAVDVVFVRFNRSVYMGEDKLQTHVIFYFARKLVVLRQWGYSYFMTQKRWSRAQEKVFASDWNDIQSFLRLFYNHSSAHF